MIYRKEGRKMFSLYDCKMLECLGKGIWGLLKLAGLIAKTVLYNWMLKPLGKWGYKKYQERKARTAVKEVERNLNSPVNELTKRDVKQSERQSFKEKINNVHTRSEQSSQSLPKSTILTSDHTL